MSTSASLYHRHRFPVEFINHCRLVIFSLCPELPRRRGNVSDARRATLLRDRPGMVSQAPPTYANQLRRRSPRAGDRWHLDEVFLKINGRLHYLWRAVDQDRDVLNILVRSKRHKRAAKKFFRKLLKRLRYVPRVLITDKLRSYGAAKGEVLSSVEHHQQKYQNNPAENSHQPTDCERR